jgi:hypothetical protein
LRPSIPDGRKTLAPDADDAGHDADLAGNGARSHPFGGEQHNAGTLGQPLLRLLGPQPAFQRAADTRIEADLGCFVSHPKLESWFAGEQQPPTHLAAGRGENDSCFIDCGY